MTTENTFRTEPKRIIVEDDPDAGDVIAILAYVYDYYAPDKTDDYQGTSEQLVHISELVDGTYHLLIGNQEWTTSVLTGRPPLDLARLVTILRDWARREGYDIEGE